jgi:hypothetical protein
VASGVRSHVEALVGQRWPRRFPVAPGWRGEREGWPESERWGTGEAH